MGLWKLVMSIGWWPDPHGSVAALVCGDIQFFWSCNDILAPTARVYGLVSHSCNFFILTPGFCSVLRESSAQCTGSSIQPLYIESGLFVVSTGEHFHGTANVPDLAFWYLVCLPTLGCFVPERESQALCPYYLLPKYHLLPCGQWGQDFSFFFLESVGRRDRYSLPLFSFWGNSYCSPKWCCFYLLSGAMMAERGGIEKPDQ